MKSASKPGGRGPEKTDGGTPSCPQPPAEDRADWTARTPGRLLLLAGWVLPQLVLLGPALVGRTVLMPADLLAIPGMYLPNPVGSGRPAHNDAELLDLPMLVHPFRQFSTAEIRAGRIPLWEPANFAGAPFAAIWPKYSPFELLYDLVPSTITLAWIQMLQSVLIGAGLWLFLHRGLKLSYWPAAIAAWCVPLTGFVTLWQGFPVVVPVYWLPWMLLLARQSVGRPWGWSNVGLAGVTGFLLLCGAADVCGLVLVTTGLYAVWLLAVENRHAGWRFAASSAAGLSTAWVVGFLLAAAYLLPLAEYVRTGNRMQARGAGYEERPPVGLQALVPVVLPNAYGSTRPGSFRVVDESRFESASSAYSGLLAVFWLAPLAWRDAKRRKEILFFAALAIVGMGWTLGFPGFVDLLRERPFNILSYNRWVFATSIAVLVLAAIGLEQLRGGKLEFRRWYLIPMALAAAFGCFCLYRAAVLPEWLETKLQIAIRQGYLSLDELPATRHGFALDYGLGAALSLVSVLGWISTFRLPWLRLAAVALLPAELFWFAAHESRQGDRSLYYPRVPALEKIASLPPGRIWGVDCLPPNLNLSHGLEDIRGYDSVDPALFVRLFNLACDPAHHSPPYAATLNAVPKLLVDGSRIKLHPVADLLNVRYLITRSPPPAELPVIWHRDDYWIVENRDALPRVFVPRTARAVKDDDEALAIMAGRAFDPRAVVLMSTRPGVPTDMEGTAKIHYESPTRARVDAAMRTDGIVVISDMWDPGWRAQLDGAACSIERVDVALRGVRIPAGTHWVEMTYDPSSVRRGFQITAAGGFLLLLWLAVLGTKSLRARLKD